MTPNQWTRSSRCANGACLDVMWKRSTRCSTGACCEVRADGGTILVRDSKLGDDSPILTFDPAAWMDFIAAVKGVGL